MKIIVAGNMPDKLLSALTDNGFIPVKSPCNSNLLPGLDYHPDMQIARIGDTLICDPKLRDEYARLLAGVRHKLVPGDKPCTCNYPGDIAYNIKVIHNKVFHNFKYTDSLLKTYLEDKFFIDVSQGYSGCSICKAGDNAIITSDRIIAQKAKEAGVDSLLISPGHIILEGFDYGFIGGASFTASGKVFFFGDISSHTDYADIAEFCRIHGTSVCSLGDGPLTDYGSAVTLD